MIFWNWGGFPPTQYPITWESIYDIFPSEHYMKKLWSVIPMHGSAVFLRVVVIFSRTGVVFLQISHTTTCTILFSVTWNHSYLGGRKMDLFSPHGVIKYTLWPASRKTNFFPRGWLFMQTGCWKTGKVMKYFFLRLEPFILRIQHWPCL